MLDLLNAKGAAKASTANGAPSVSRETGKRDGLVYLPLSRILDNPYQPRCHYDAEHILNLARSIQSLRQELPTTKGLQQIPMARLGVMGLGGFDQVARDVYSQDKLQLLIGSNSNYVVQLMFGHSRYRAFCLLEMGLKAASNGGALGIDFSSVAELETRYADLFERYYDCVSMPVVLGFALDHQMWHHAITENSQRKNITAIEEATSIQRAMDEFGLTTEEAGAPFGYARSTTANKLRLLELPEDVRGQISAGALSERHGRELLPLASDQRRLSAVVAETVQKGLTVRQMAENVKWAAKQVAEEQERERQFAAARQACATWRLPGQTQPVGDVAPEDRWAYSFRQNSPDDVALLTSGACGPACECLVLTYKTINHEVHYRPDAHNAPCVMLGCKGEHECRDKKLAALIGHSVELDNAKRQEEDRKAERQRKLLANEAAAHQIWDVWLREQNKQQLWNDLRFWRVAFTRGDWRLADHIKKAPTVQDACDALLGMIFDGTKRYQNEYGESTYDLETLQQTIADLSGREMKEQNG